MNAVYCVSAAGSDPHTFLSGCADGTVRLFDARAPKSVAALGFGGVAHEGMVMCIKSAGHVALSGGRDGNLMWWDVRGLGAGSCGSKPLATVNVDGQMVMRVAFAGK